LALISARTLEHYNQRAAEFWEGTRDHDVKQNIDACCAHPRRASVSHPDLGCVPARPTRSAPSLHRSASKRPPPPRWRASTSGREVWEQIRRWTFPPPLR
jgi:hypothetical protein